MAALANGESLSEGTTEKTQVKASDSAQLGLGKGRTGKAITKAMA